MNITIDMVTGCTGNSLTDGSTSTLNAFAWEDVSH